MELSPLEITQREFSRKMRGLDPDEVRAFLEQVAEEMTRLLQQSADHASLVQRLEAQVRALEDREDAVRNTLVTAQKMTDDIKSNAKREADLIIKESELRAEKLLEQAHQKLGQVQAEIAELRRQRDLFAARLRGHIKTHQDLLDAAIPDKPTTPK
jgi:cell division initiation protein